MNYSVIKKTDIADGEGVRVTLFVSGCRNMCKGCFQPCTWNFEYGQPFTDKTVEEILEALSFDYIQGLTLLGGEPFEPENQKDLLELLKIVKEKYPQKDVWCFFVFLLDKEILGKSRANTNTAKEMLKYIDVLVDGRFVESEKDLTLNFRGSRNQRIILVKDTLDSGKIVLSKLN